MENKKPKKWNEFSKGEKRTFYAAFGIFAFTILLIIWAGSGSSQEPSLDDMKWAEMTDAQKAQFSGRKLQSTNATLFQMHVVEQISNKFKYPAAVEFENKYQVVTGARLKDATSGLYFNNGSLTAKNAFGVPVSYLWEIEFECNESFRIKRIDVFEL